MKPSQKKKIGKESRASVGVARVRHAQDELELRVQERTTALAQANEVLKKQALLLDLAHDAIIVRSVNSNIVSWNSGAERTYGWGKEDALGKIAHELLQTEFTTSFEEVERELLAVGFWEGILVHARRDKVRITVRSRQVLQRDERGQPKTILEINRDITEHKRAEAALAESEQRLQSIMDSNPSIIFIKDNQGRYLYVNHQFQEQLPGIPRDQMLGKTAKELFPPGQAEVFSHNDLQVLQSGIPMQFEEIVSNADGLHTGLVTKFPLRDAGGMIYGICGIVIDITKRKRAEEALRGSEARLRALVESMDDIAFEIDDQGRYLTVWTANESLLARPKRKLIGQSLASVLDKETAPSLLETFQRVMRTGHAESTEYMLNLPEGPRWFSGRISPIRAEDGSYRTVCLLVRDITNRRKLEDEVKESEARFRSTFQALEVGVAVVGPRTEAFLYNDAALELLGLTQEQLKGLSAYDPQWRVYHEDGSPFAGDDHPSARALATGQPVRNVVAEVYRPTKGDSRWLLCNAIPRLGADGSVAEVICSFSDITTRKKAELDQKQAEDAVRELSGNLLHLQDEERRRMARELHDSTAQAFTALSLNLASALQSINPTEQPQVSKALTESLALADQACREVRTFSYLLHPPLLDEAGLSHALRYYVDGFVQRTNIKVELEVSSEPGRLSRDMEMALFRVVQECLTNIHRHSESAKAEIRLVQDTHNVSLEVRDYGKGLSAKPYARLEDIPVTLGVGIRGMRERVRQLGGELEVSSAEPGTFVRASLPLVRVGKL